ncbi:D-amino-acid transaminase [Dongia soli]|uniref:Probable branched-chain-amino-acid aminotransferase n=1 Tax=Dongia soli TaxID=600628 RepID=A0ABU5EAK3_9PROT|nr:D-amino-acid transaminase [Dongia soli]MDY0883084.1 D-amino-acid transaminase [Dongia soli]
MSRFCYVNGRYLPHANGMVHIEDRGYQLADGIYEVVPIYHGKLVDMEQHLDRLAYSLGELRIAPPMERNALRLVMRELIARNGVTNGLIYLQVTRGVAPREHKFPKKTKSSLVMTTKKTKPVAPELLEKGAAIITQRDLRWLRRDIKSIGLLPNVLAKQAASEQGAFEAWLVDDAGYITEGSSTNAWIVKAGPDGKARELITRPLGHDILGGITRRGVVDLAKEQGLNLVQRPFSLEEALSAAEAFQTSSSAFVLPVTSIDGKAIGDGKPGPMTMRLREIYCRYAEQGE